MAFLGGMAYNESTGFNWKDYLPLKRIFPTKSNGLHLKVH